MLRNLVAVLAAFVTVAVAAPAQALYFPSGWDNVVTVDKDDVGLNFVVDFHGKVAGNHTSQLSALGNFTFRGATNSNKTYTFDYTLTNDSNYDSRIRAFGFDTQTPTPNPVSIDGITGFSNQFTNVNFIEGVGTMDACFAVSSNTSCTQHSNTGGITKGNSMNGSFSLTFANTMESIDFNHFALKFLSVNPTIGGQDWGAGLGQIISVTPPSQAIVAPEPGTWLMLLGGFGMVGWAMRRRKSRPLLAGLQAA